MKDIGSGIHTQIFVFLNKRRCQQSCHIFCVYKNTKQKDSFPQVVIGLVDCAVDKTRLSCG